MVIDFPVVMINYTWRPIRLLNVNFQQIGIQIWAIYYPRGEIGGGGNGVDMMESIDGVALIMDIETNMNLGEWVLTWKHECGDFTKLLKSILA